MKRLGLPLALSLTLHALLLLAFVIPWLPGDEDLPLTGGGGGSGVTIEIVGGLGPSGRGGREAEAPPLNPPSVAEPPKKDSKKMMMKTRPPQKAKAGRPEGDDVPVGSPSPAGPGQGSLSVGPGSGAGGTSAVLAQIHARIERAKRYPMVARKMQIEGVSFVRFAIDAGGQPQGLALKSSSGSSVLDEEALATIKRAAPYPAYPEALEIGIRFEIDK